MTFGVPEFDWVWDTNSRSTATLLSCDNRKVSFHSEYSCGTAAIRGSKELAEGQHFWEIKMTSPVYGTDMVNVYSYHLNSNLGRQKDKIVSKFKTVYSFLYRWLASVLLMLIWTTTDTHSAACWEKTQTAGVCLTLVRLIQQ